jgi:glycosyltransferase involved in cell wall biosynthesis
MLSDDALIGAKVVVSAIGNEQVEPQESEEFTIRFGKVPGLESVGVGKKVRTFSEGLIELNDRETVSDVASSAVTLPSDARGFVVLRTRQRGKSYRVFRPSLVRETEQQWADALSTLLGDQDLRARLGAKGRRDAVAHFSLASQQGKLIDLFKSL